MPKLTLKLWNRINKFIDDYKLLNKKSRILLAVSGGPDSMMLLHFFHKARDNYFAVFHLNHMIRKESEKDEKIIFDYCERNSLDFAIERIDIKRMANKEKKNLEAYARDIRYKMFERYARKFKCDIIATAHNADENVETVLLNLFRGTDPLSLCGIPVKRRLGSFYVIRPLLCIRKNEILCYLEENKIRYAVDKTNFDTYYTRNWLRHKIIPDIEKRYSGFSQRIVKMCEKLKKIIGM